MTKKQKGISVLVLVLIVFLGGIYFYTTKKTEQPTNQSANSTIVYDKPAEYDKAVDTIKSCIKAENEKNVNEAMKYRLNTENNMKLEKELISNIKSIKFISAEKAKTEFKPAEYTLANGEKVKADKGILLNVTYEVYYKKDNQPEKNGKNSMFFTVIKLNDGYKIVSQGTGP